MRSGAVGTRRWVVKVALRAVRRSANKQTKKRKVLVENASLVIYFLCKQRLPLGGGRAMILNSPILYLRVRSPLPVVWVSPNRNLRSPVSSIDCRKVNYSFLSPVGNFFVLKKMWEWNLPLGGV